VAIATRNRQQDAETWWPAVAVNDAGFAPQRRDARYHRAKVVTSGTYSRLQGIEVDAVPSGER
jgi:hypothetical protein